MSMLNEHIGELYPTNDGRYQYMIVDWIDNKNVTVELQKPYEDGEEPYRRTTTFQRIREGLGYPGMAVNHPNSLGHIQNQQFKEEWEGKIFTTCDGTGQFQIVEYINAHDVIIHFLGTLCYQHRDLIAIKRNQVQYPFLCNKPGCTNPVYFGDPYKKYMGSYFLTTEGRRRVAEGLFPGQSEVYRVIDYQGKNNVTVQFQDEYGYITTCSTSDASRGSIRNNFKRNQYGAFLGDVDLNRTEEEKLCFNRWRHMVRRVHEIDEHPSYEGVILAPEWYCYANFKIWYMNETSNLNPNYISEFHIDKDLKYPFYMQYTNGAKMYGPTTASVMPKELNSKIVGINNKENWPSILEYANYYLSENAISLDTYNAIISQIQ